MTDPTKYFGCELGAQVQMDAKAERYIVNGAHDAARLQDLLDGFIKKFVLCTECDNPETKLVSRLLLGLSSVVGPLTFAGGSASRPSAASSRRALPAATARTWT